MVLQANPYWRVLRAGLNLRTLRDAKHLTSALCKFFVKYSLLMNTTDRESALAQPAENSQEEMISNA